MSREATQAPPGAAERWSLCRVGKVDDFAPGKAHIVDVEGLEIGIYNIESTFYAIRNYCPHRGAPICLGSVGGTMLPSEPGTFDYGLDGRVIICPWHRWEWDLTSGLSPFAADKRKLIKYEIHVDEGDNVVVRVPRRKPSDGDTE